MIPLENIRDVPRYIRGLSKPELLPRFVQVSTSQVASMRLDMQKKKKNQLIEVEVILGDESDKKVSCVHTGSKARTILRVV